MEEKREILRNGLNPRVSRKIKESDQSLKSLNEKGVNLNINLLKLPLQERLWKSMIARTKK